jgi:hypothetical protein
VLQAGVPGAMAVLVVNRLEPVEVQYRKRECPSSPFGPRDVFEEVLFPGPAVVGPGEVVAGRQLPEGAHGRVEALQVLDQPARRALHEPQIALPEPRIGRVAHAAQSAVKAPV